MQTLDLVATNGPCPTSTERVELEEPEKFRLLRDTSDSFSIHALHTKTKSTSQDAAERNLPHIHCRPFRTVVKPVLLSGDSALRDTSIHGAIPRRWLRRAANALS